MNDYLVKDTDRWCMVSNIYSNNGINEIESEEIKYFLFNSDYYSDSYIEIDDEKIDWDESGANIIGISNERSLLKSPEPILSKSIREKEQVIYNRSQANLIKRRMSRIILNTKVDILNVTVKRSFEFRPVKWWLFKTVQSRINESLESSTVRYRIERKGKTWLNQIKNLIKKRRS